MNKRSSASTFEMDSEKLEEIIEEVAKTISPSYSYPEMPEEIFKIFEYLPELFQDESEEQYIDALSIAMQTSYKNGLYQFAYIQYHMLFMTSIYFVLLKLYTLHHEEIKQALYYLLKDRYRDFFGEDNKKHGNLYFGSFAVIGESDVFKLLHVVGMAPDLEGELKKLVKERNNYAHANGRLLLTSEEYFLKKIRTFNNCIDRVFALIKSDILSLYQSTLRDPNFYDPDIRAYMDVDQQIKEELVRAYSLSRYELNWCRKFDIQKLASHDDFKNIKELHIALSRYYKSLKDET